MYTYPIMKKLLTWKKIILYVILILIAWAIYSFIQAQNAPAQVSVTTLKRADLVVTVTANGKIESTQTSSPRFASSGRISVLLVEEGDSVKNGQVLGYLDGSDIKQQENQSWSDYKIALEELREFELNNKDKPQDDRYWINKNQLEARRDRSAAVVAQARTGYNSRTLIATQDGTVTKLHKRQGDVVTSEPVLDIQNQQQLEFAAEVDEQDIGDVNVGQLVKLNLDAFPREELDAEVIEIETIAKTGTTGNTFFPVKLRVNSAGKTLRIGMNGDAVITTAQQANRILLPLEYLVEEDGQAFVMTLEGNTIKKQPVTTGMQNDIEIDVIEGLSEQTQIITSDTSQLKENQQVIVTEK